ncbi:unnamed protein product [Fusarium fujikuroi]|nr:unnamed protein product [Fusarium fujikuroi]
MDYTEFCPKTGCSHNELHMELKAFREASFCLFYRQPLIKAVKVINLTASSPPRPSSITIQTERIQPIPITYTNAINIATKSQKHNITVISHKSIITIKLKATFYIASGYLKEVIPGISIPKYNKGVKSKNIKSKIIAPLGSIFLSYNKIVHFIILSCHKEFSLINDTLRPNKQAIKQAETEIPASKRIIKIKREIKNKKEPIQDKRKENDIKAEIKVKVKAKKIKGKEERQHEDLDAFEAFLQSTISDKD